MDDRRVFMKNIVHLLPYDGIGGVETAARSMVEVPLADFNFHVDYIFKLTACRETLGTFSPLPILGAIRWIVAKPPDVLIASLWRACIVGVCAKLLRPRLKLVLFLHYPADVHWVDNVITRLAGFLADFVWADSLATLARRLPNLPPAKGRVISFVTARIAENHARPVRPVFVFWGRIHLQKGLERALAIFAAVREHYPTARFIVIGPDGGDLARVEKLASDLDLTGAVQFLGGVDFSTIAQQASSAGFYLQTSSLEGMAMSVVEAMQLGLVPVVTPVGEIAQYCQHGLNALIVESNAAAVDEIVALLKDDQRYQRLRKNAVDTWAEKPLYAESVLQACRDIFAGGAGSAARQI
jgi:glycosyltransferase involved in cell wall biosynthesis